MTAGPGVRRPFAARNAQVVVVAAVVGAAVGIAVAGFERVVFDVLLDPLNRLPLWCVALAPSVGLALAAVALRIIGGGVSPSTSDEYLRAFHDPGVDLGWHTFAGRVTASICTLGLGGPMGLEGPSIYIGATAGAQAQRRLPGVFRGADRRLLLVAGAAAGVAAIFKAPATGAVFALEVPYQDDLARRMLLPALVAAASSYLTYAAINGTARLFPVAGEPAVDLKDLLGAVALGIVAGLGARLFAALLRRAKTFSASTHPVVRVVLAGAALAGLFALGRIATGESLVLGPGYSALQWALDPGHATWLVIFVLALRCSATLATVGGGGVGGLFVPLVVAGALTGRAVGGAVHALDTDLFAVIGVAAFLGAGYRVPLAAVVFVAETTGRPGFIVPGLFAAVAAELMMGRQSVTAYQVAAERA